MAPLRDDASAALVRHSDTVFCVDAVFVSYDNSNNSTNSHSNNDNDNDNQAEKHSQSEVWAVSGGVDDNAWLFCVDCETQDILFEAIMPGHSDTVACVAFQPQIDTSKTKKNENESASNLPQFVATGGYDATIRLWRMDEAVLLRQTELEAARDAALAAKTPKSSSLQSNASDQAATSSTSVDDAVRERSAGTPDSTSHGKEADSSDGDAVSNGNGFSSDEEAILDSEEDASETGDRRPEVLVQMQAEVVLDGPGGGIEWLQWHPSGTVLLAGCSDGTLWMWKAPSGEFMQIFSGHAGVPVSAGGFTSVSAKKIVSGSEDGTVRVWEPRTGASAVVFQAGKTVQWDLDSVPVTCMEFHPEDAAVVFVGFADGSLRMCNLNTGKVLQTMVSPNLQTAHGDSVEAIVCCPSVGSTGVSLVVSGGVDGRLCSWDTQSRQLRASCLMGATTFSEPATALNTDDKSVEHEKEENFERDINQSAKADNETDAEDDDSAPAIMDVCWLAGTNVVACACSDGCIRLVDILNGQLRQELLGHSDAILNLKCHLLNEAKELQQQGGASRSLSSAIDEGIEDNATHILISASDDHSARIFFVDATKSQQL